MTVKDRLPELQANSSNKGDTSPGKKKKRFPFMSKSNGKYADEAHEMEEGRAFRSASVGYTPGTTAKPQTLEDFLTDSAMVDEAITRLADDIHLMKRLQAECTSVSITTSGGAEQNTKARDKLDTLSLQVRKESRDLLNKLKSIEDELNASKRGPEGAIYASSAEYRIKSTQHNTLTKRLLDCMHEFNTLQTTYTDRCKDLFRRQLEITGHCVDDYRLNELLESESPAIFTQDYMAQTQLAKQQLADIKARHEELRKLEQSIVEMHGMFHDLAILVQNQGELIDRIETNLANVGDHVERGTKQLQEAKKKKYQSMKCKIIMYTVGGVLLILIITSLIPFI